MPDFDEPTHRAVLAKIETRLDGLDTQIGRLDSLAIETRDLVMEIRGQRTAEQHAADRAADRAIQHAADRAEDRETDRIERAALPGAPATPPAPPEPPSRLKRWSLVVVIAAGVVGLLGGLRSALEVVINVGHATIVAILHHP